MSIFQMSYCSMILSVRIAVCVEYIILSKGGLHVETQYKEVMRQSTLRRYSKEMFSESISSEISFGFNFNST